MTFGFSSGLGRVLAEGLATAASDHDKIKVAGNVLELPCDRPRHRVRTG
jgi:hypothetical protein